MLGMYWLGVACGTGLCVFITGLLIEMNVLPPWPDVPIGLVRSCGAFVAAAAMIGAVRMKRRG
jgi:hypothetical protein